MAYFCLVSISTFRNMRISFIKKVTRVDKATIVAKDATLCVAFLVLFLEFSPRQPD